VREINLDQAQHFMNWKQAMVLHLINTIYVLPQVQIGGQYKEVIL